MAANVLDARARLVVESAILEGLSNAAILERLRVAGFKSVTPQALSHYRRKMLPQTIDRDLEILQGGASAYAARVSGMVESAQALRRYGLKDGQVSGEKGSLLALKFAAETEVAIQRVFDSLERRLLEWKRSEQDDVRLGLQKGAAKIAQERWALEKLLAERELELLELEEQSSRAEGVEVPAGSELSADTEGS